MKKRVVHLKDEPLEPRDQCKTTSYFFIFTQLKLKAVLKITHLFKLDLETGIQITKEKK